MKMTYSSSNPYRHSYTHHVFMNGGGCNGFSRLHPRAPGFSMMESLVAIAVFALGFVAVAAIFPVGVILQKGAASDVLTQQVVRNVKAMLQSRKFSHDDLTDPNNLKFINDVLQNGNPNLEVQPVLKQDAPGDLLNQPGILQPGNIFEQWMLNDRSYFFMRNNLGGNAYHPQHTAELGDPTATEFNRAFYWVPLIRRTQLPTGPSDWQVFVFILRHDSATHDRSSNSSATDAFSDVWANHDGYRSQNGIQYWHVPGVRSLTVTSVNTNRFTVNNNWTGAGSGLEIVAGDLVLDSNGVVHTVLTATTGFIDVKGVIPKTAATPPNRLWYARPAAAGRPSPATEILILTDVVE